MRRPAQIYTLLAAAQETGAEVRLRLVGRPGDVRGRVRLLTAEHAALTGSGETVPLRSVTMAWAIPPST